MHAFSAWTLHRGLWKREAVGDRSSADRTDTDMVLRTHQHLISTTTPGTSVSPGPRVRGKPRHARAESGTGAPGQARAGCAPRTRGVSPPLGVPSPQCPGARPRELTSPRTAAQGAGQGPGRGRDARLPLHSDPAPLRLQHRPDADCPAGARSLLVAAASPAPRSARAGAGSGTRSQGDEAKLRAAGWQRGAP